MPSWACLEWSSSCGAVVKLRASDSISFPDPIPPTLFLDTDPLVFQGTPWITNLPVVPEPSPALLLLLATALFLHRRHRR